MLWDDATATGVFNDDDDDDDGTRPAVGGT